MIKYFSHVKHKKAHFFEVISMKQTAKEANIRNSNIELLRIVCIFLIILRHYSTQVNYGDINTEVWTWQRLFLQVITIGGSTANNIFLLISGYFLIGKKVNFKRVVVLIAEMFFYSWIIMIVLYTTGVLPFSFKEMGKALFPIWFGYNWYVCCYVILCCFLPFINPFLESLSKERYQRLLMISILIWSVAYTFYGKNYLGTDFSIDHFVIIYALGGYIKKYGLSLKKMKWRNCFIICALVHIASVLSLNLLGKYLGVKTLITHATFFSDATNILSVIVATSAFAWVISAKPHYSKGVNIIAKSVIGVFLIHHNPLMRQVLWEILYPNVNYFTSDFFALHCLIKVSSIFVACILIDQVRLLTVDRLFNIYLDHHWESICLKCNKIKDKVKRLDLFKPDEQ